MHFSSKRSLPPDDKSSNATTGLRQREKDTTVSPQSPLQWLSAAATEEEEALARLIHRFVSPGNAVPDSGGGDCWRRRCLNSNSCTTSHPHQTSPTSNFSHCCPRSSHVASVPQLHTQRWRWTQPSARTLRTSRELRATRRDSEHKADSVRLRRRTKFRDRLCSWFMQTPQRRRRDVRCITVGQLHWVSLVFPRLLDFLKQTVPAEHTHK